MKNISKTLNLLLAIALVLVTVKYVSATKLSSDTASEEKQEVSEGMSAIDAIMTRSSVRAYTAKPVESDKVETMLKAAMAAPTAVNKQPWQFVVVDDKDVLNQIPPIIKGASMAKRAQLAIVVCGEPKKSVKDLPDFWIQDVSAATENLLLAAHSLGLGAVWCGAFPDKDNRVSKLQGVLGLPEDVIPLSVVVIGYPAGEPKIKDKWMPEKVSYNKFGNK